MESNTSTLDTAKHHHHVDIDAADEEDGPKRLRLRLLLFVSVNHSFLVALLFFLYGRRSQQGSSHSGVHEIRRLPYQRILLYCKMILPAIVCQLCLQWLQTITIPSKLDPPSHEPSTVSPIVLFPILLSAFDFAISTCVERLGKARATVYLEQLQIERRRVVSIYWTILIQIDVVLGGLFPVDVLSASAFHLTDIPQYFFAYIWGRLSVATGDFHILAIFPPVTMPFLSLAVSGFFSHAALLDLFVTAIPGLSQHEQLTESVQAAMARIGGGFYPQAVMYRVWKQLSFASIAPALLETFNQTTDEDCAVTLLGLGRRRLKRYAYATFLLYLPVSKLVQIGIATMAMRLPESLGTLREMWFCRGMIASGVMYGGRGAVNAIVAWTVACWVVEYIPFASQIL